MTDDFNSAAAHFISAKVSKKEKRNKSQKRVSGSALTCIVDWISDLSSVVLLLKFQLSVTLVAELFLRLTFRGVKCSTQAGILHTHTHTHTEAPTLLAPVKRK